MTKIKKFIDFNSPSNEEDILYIFDFDDTLVVTPRFEDQAIEFLKENLTIESLLNVSVSRINKSLKDLKWEDNRIYIDDPLNKIKIGENDRYWVRKGKRIYLLQPDEYSLSEMSLPTKLKELSDKYKLVKNKCIVTARPKQMKDKIEKVLEFLGLELPNYGLYLYPYINHYKAGTWKGNKIIEILSKSKFKKAIFYDDNPKYIKAVNKVISENLPKDIDFKSIKVD